MLLKGSCHCRAVVVAVKAASRCATRSATAQSAARTCSLYPEESTDDRCKRRRWGWIRSRRSYAAVDGRRPALDLRDIYALGLSHWKGMISVVEFDDWPQAVRLEPDIHSQRQRPLKVRYLVHEIGEAAWGRILTSSEAGAVRMPARLGHRQPYNKLKLGIDFRHVEQKKAADIALYVAIRTHDDAEVAVEEGVFRVAPSSSSQPAGHAKASAIGRPMNSLPQHAHRQWCAAASKAKQRPAGALRPMP